MIDASHRWRVILLPGGVLPAELAYKSLLTELAGDTDARIKDLELYAGESPPPNYSLTPKWPGLRGWPTRPASTSFILSAIKAAEPPP